MLSSAPRTVKVTVTPILISGSPPLNILGVHQPYTPRSIVETETSDGVAGTGETYGTRDHPDEEIAAVRALADTFTDGGPEVTDTPGPASNPPGMRRPARTNGSTGCRSATTATTSRPCGASTPTGRSHRSRGGDPGWPEPHP
ncbi:hypothetical protein GCM10010094_67520 [Streptomyces flaveus]|uniref:Uncharacterized protein n=1 Tax=Streptomyces flaveus TaxID=66370 RepID=A0A917VLV1_9ACTN|nr:hypothetical protein GCM10010094_67520 [Streptomyces flaveus]